MRGKNRKDLHPARKRGKRWQFWKPKISHIPMASGTPFEKTAVENVNLSVEKGAFVGVIGHTGSGKSTLIQMLNGLIRPTSGQVLLNGEDIWAKPKEIRRVRFQVGMVFQYPEYQLFEETVYKDIAFGPKNMGLDAEEIDRRVRDAAAFVGLHETLLDKSPFELSGGQKRRVAIAGVIAMEPKVLVLDEPTAGLDPQGRDAILAQIQAYHRAKGAAVVLVSHSMEGERQERGPHRGAVRQERYIWRARRSRCLPGLMNWSRWGWMCLR